MRIRTFRIACVPIGMVANSGVGAMLKALPSAGLTDRWQVKIEHTVCFGCKSVKPIASMASARPEYPAVLVDFGRNRWLSGRITGYAEVIPRGLP